MYENVAGQITGMQYENEFNCSRVLMYLVLIQHGNEIFKSERSWCRTNINLIRNVQSVRYRCLCCRCLNSNGEIRQDTRQDRCLDHLVSHMSLAAAVKPRILRLLNGKHTNIYSQFFGYLLAHLYEQMHSFHSKQRYYLFFGTAFSFN